MAQSRPDRPTLTVEGGPLDGFAVSLAPGETIVVGSGPGVRLRLEHPDVAAAHARVGWDELGVSIADSGSGHGTWLNGEPVEAAPLGDGDVVQLADPKKRRAVPALRVRLPEGLADVTANEPIAPTHAPPVRTAPPSTPPAFVRLPPRPVRHGRFDPLRLGLVVGLLALVAAGGLFAKRLFFSAPVIASVQPPAAEPAQTLTLAGSRLGDVAGATTVWFGDVPVPADAPAGGSLRVKVPTAAPGEVSLVVETPSGRSRRTPFRVLPVLRSSGLDPEGGLPGDEVVLRGLGFAAGAAVSVGSAPAEVLAVEAQAVRFRVPPSTAAPGSRLPVVATVDGRSTAPVPIVLGRVPLVESVEPPRAAAGEVVRLHGVGFAPESEGNVVTFDGAGALVVAANRSELAVVAPVPSGPERETLASLVVQARGRASEPRAYPLLRLVEGAWVPRCVAQPAGSGGQVLVGTEIAPLMMLSSRDEARSRTARALKTCAQIDAALNRARAGEAVSFEARDHPSGGTGVGIVGRADMVERVTPQDAAGYEKPPGLAPRRQAPSPAEVARLWAALLNGLVVVTTSGEPPSAASLPPAAARAYAELRAALPWQYGVGVASARVAGLSSETRRRLREAALVVP
jgi:hypothetical protein